MIRTAPSRAGTGIALVVIGTALVLGGFAGRSFAKEHSALGYVALQSPAGAWGVYQLEDRTDFRFELDEETATESSAAVFRVTDQRRELVFTGTPDEAVFFVETQGSDPVRTGPETEVHAWISAQQGKEDDHLGANMVIAGGSMLIVAGLVLWLRR